MQEIIRKEIKSPCYICDGTGKTKVTSYPVYGVVQYELCKHCEGTGKHVETFYYHIVNGICVSGDTLK